MSLVVWSASLHPWLETTAGQHYGPIAIQDGDVTYYSIIIHVPNTQILVEVVSPERPSATTVYTDALRRLRVADACVRNQCAEKDPGVWVPLAVSRGVSNLTEMRARRARDSPSGRGVAATPFPPAQARLLLGRHERERGPLRFRGGRLPEDVRAPQGRCRRKRSRDAN